MQIRASLLTLLILCNVAACQPDDSSPCAPPSISHFQELIDERYVAPFKAGDTETWLELFAPNATALHNRVPAFIGREAVAGFGAVVSDTFEVTEMEVIVEEVDNSGEWAFTRGSYVSHFLDRKSGASSPWGREEGKFLMLWECEQPTGWRIRIDMGNSNG